MKTITQYKAAFIAQAFNAQRVVDAGGDFKFFFDNKDIELAWKLEDYLEEMHILNASVNA